MLLQSALLPSLLRVVLLVLVRVIPLSMLVKRFVIGFCCCSSSSSGEWRRALGGRMEKALQQHDDGDVKVWAVRMLVARRRMMVGLRWGIGIVGILFVLMGAATI